MPRKQTRRPPLATLMRRWSAVAVVLIVGYFYYHPFRAYLSARGQLGATQREVAQLSAQRRDLQRRLTASASLAELSRQARELGYVRPGERLFIVKGIEAWRHARTTLHEHGVGP